MSDLKRIYTRGNSNNFPSLAVERKKHPRDDQENHKENYWSGHLFPPKES